MKRENNVFLLIGLVTFVLSEENINLPDPQFDEKPDLSRMFDVELARYMNPLEYQAKDLLKDFTNNKIKIQELNEKVIEILEKIVTEFSRVKESGPNDELENLKIFDFLIKDFYGLVDLILRKPIRQSYEANVKLAKDSAKAFYKYLSNKAKVKEQLQKV